MGAIRDRLRFDVNATDTGTSAIDAFSHGHGVCQDFAHVFIAAARHLGIPARYVGGYLYRADRPDGQEAGHAWAEALVDDLGWVGFDPANDISPTEAYVRVAMGLDYLGAAPVRGTRYGGAGETSRRPHSHSAIRPGRSARPCDAFFVATRSAMARNWPLRASRGASLTMTYCVGILVRDGLVMIADTRTNAGLDNIAVFRKLHSSRRRASGFSASPPPAISLSASRCSR